MTGQQQERSLTQEQRDWLTIRIQRLRSRMKTVGPFRQAGIHRTIKGMKEQLRTGVWCPFDAAGDRNTHRPRS